METNITNHSTISWRVTPSGALIYISLYFAIALMCVFGNGLVIISFLRFKQVRGVMNNYFLFGLAIADFLTGLIAIPLAVYNRLVISGPSCHALTRSLMFSPAYILGATSWSHLVAITADRYIAVNRPMRYHLIMTRRKVVGILLFVWGFGLCFGSMPGLNLGGDPDQWVCELQQYESSGVEVHNIAASFLLPFFMLVLICVYARIFYVAFIKKNFARTQSISVSASANALNTQARKTATITSTIVIVSYTICWLPHSFKFIFESYFATDLRSLLVIQTSCEMLAYINSFINPIIYAWKNPRFRKAYQQILFCFFGSSLKPRADPQKESTEYSTYL